MSPSVEARSRPAPPLRVPRELAPPPAQEVARRPARWSAVVGALTLPVDELPPGLALTPPSWFLPANPLVLTVRDDESAEYLTEVFGEAITADDVRRFAFWLYEGEADLAVAAFEFRDPARVVDARRAFVPERDGDVAAFVESESVLAVVLGRRRDETFRLVEELVRKRLR